MGDKMSPLHKPKSHKNNMSPFLSTKSLSVISVTCTNLRGLGLTVKDLADKK